MRMWPWLLGLGMFAGLAGVGAALYVLDDYGITPRALGPYIAKRSDGHNAAIEGIGRAAQNWLTRVDRGEQPLRSMEWRSSIGAQPVAAQSVSRGQEVLVSNDVEWLRAMAGAQPGQSITLLPGRYLIDHSVDVMRPGEEGAPITVRAQVPGSVTVESATDEALRIQAPYWRFENLTIRGKCKGATQCEHFFHISGNAHHFVAVNNTIVDFDAHFKINGDGGKFPDHGLIASNTLRNDSARESSKPVTPVDLVAASHWRIERNLISDFIKSSGDKISYGAFVKGAGSNNVIAQNIVICEDKLRGLPGQRVGLSLGGGGTGKNYCRDGRCITEQTGGVIRSNLVVSCSDDGIYLNAASRSKLVHNTLLDTGGISVRFAESSAEIEGNLVDGSIRSRDGGILHLGDNRQTATARLYLGGHPQRDLFRDATALDFGWRTPADSRLAASEEVPDLCGGKRPGTPRYGAFEDFNACLAKP
ncbi:right-handed parallel beta-helix repeat-containing protein [Duganella sp. FT92W]|uniref:Right-handed parallel beta-helix repeat-containing protein n=1 Tax=Pseudoduganella rivuli TaxID=2666085 RepID=A0A7X2LWW1_9BURK|nr:NosD domain-containing protein [Pseudoduganella rivuli]MRV76428.1 right-handed parallel beta-helix repeat-containing protein [Pseudoduganella rivuli]